MPQSSDKMTTVYEIYVLGNVVVDNLTEVIVMIAANDNSNGVFNFAEPYVRSLDEGETLSIGYLFL